MRLPVSGGGAGRVAESGVFSLEAEGREVELIGPDTTLLLRDLITIIGITPRLVDEPLRGVDITNGPKPNDTRPDNVSDNDAGCGPGKLLLPRETILWTAIGFADGSPRQVRHTLFHIHFFQISPLRDRHS